LICKRTPQHVNEAAECLGGLGYVEDSVVSRLTESAHAFGGLRDADAATGLLQRFDRS
jgi:alkylation response protein AidB-like acyl-CoA dehydrogenase